MHKLLIILLFLIGLVKTISAQDLHFSQFYANPLYLAPSFAGGAGEPRAVVNFRDQWPKIPGNFITYSFSFDYYLEPFKSGFGLYANSENAGQGKLVTTNIGLAYSYKINITNNLVFQPGLAAYYHDRFTDYSRITFADQYYNGQYIGATSDVLPEDRVRHADFTMSGLFYHKKFWVGYNIDHLMNLSPVLRNDFRYLNIRASLFGGYKYSLSKRIRDKNNEYLQAAFQYYYQSYTHQLNIGGYYNRLPFIVGVWYRGIPLVNKYFSADALTFLGGLKYYSFTFSYSYDMTLGKLISQTGGSHEISIIYTFQAPGRVKKKYKMIPCPEI